MDTDTPINIGIDKVRVGCILVPPYYRDESDWESVKGGKKIFWPISEDTGISLFTNQFNGVRRGYLTFNPARIIDPHGITCASWAETLVAIGGCAQIAYEHHLCFRPTVHELDMYGLHLAADFGPIPDMERVMRKALTLKSFRGMNPRGYWSHDGTRIESIYFKTATRGQIKIYDKSAKEKLPISLLRIELETVRDLHISDGTDTVGDITTDVVQRLFRTRLEPLIKALHPTRPKFVDEIISNSRDAKILVQICGREFLARHNIFPKITDQYKRNKTEFDKKFFYGDIEDLL
jgi:hypothetical protein